MPNWVSNSLRIEGTPSDIARLKAQVGAPLPFTYHEWNASEQLIKITEVHHNPVFSFHNIVPEPDVDLPPDVDLSAHAEQGREWRYKHWGCKWDVAVIDGRPDEGAVLREEADNRLVYSFDTPYVPPLEAIEALSQQYPACRMVLRFWEECGWSGEVVFQAGEHRVVR